ncbi:type I 3-dehydroquinate dehydratase [Acetobacterium bakii]|uniref:3-dehydroquinate dehydratase n=1 Tax=Acetobacterium bakii TaxID=52689 RepID=A0A0L6U2Q0_9FIRM|nr:type I 3-dehydroquinate dehydratase [Acetobacterium bakii]KNZ42781.1 hypothetical protein AKG39_03375 [Acetobacterium bakii]
MVANRKIIEKNKFASCMPMISKNEIVLYKETEKNESQYDFIEWRRDYFRPGEILTAEEEITVFKKFKKASLNSGIIYTFRSHCEGGAFEIKDSVRLKAIEAAASLADYVDVELKSDADFLKSVKEILKNTDCGLILSHHNFIKTPDGKEIKEIFDAMENQNADILKLAVMPSSEADVRQLISATLIKNQSIAKPIIAIAMGTLGVITRIAPDLCGGSLTYVAGSGTTAPGQITLEEMLLYRKFLGLIV